jgi:hypothetical protein
MSKVYMLIAAFAVVVTTGCQDGLVSTESSDASVYVAGNSESLSKGPAGLIWADGELFRTLGTPTEFNPDHGPFDRLFKGSFKDDIGAISESKPGDADFNGGRWETWVLKQGVMTDYSNADSVDDLNLNDFELEGKYFECPLAPQRGNGHS